MKSCTFKTRFKELKKEKGYKLQEIADKLHISINGLNAYTKPSTAKIPPSDMLIKIAELFDVDVDYLINDKRNCKKYTSQTICDVTMLNETSANFLCQLDLDSIDMLNELFAEPLFNSLLAEIIYFTRFSRNEEYISQNVIDNSQEFLYYDKQTQISMQKFVVTDTFSKLLDKLYNLHNDIDSEIKLLKKNIIDNVSLALEHKEDNDLIYYLINNFQWRLKKIAPLDPLCNISPDEFIQNISNLSNNIN